MFSHLVIFLNNTPPFHFLIFPSPLGFSLFNTFHTSQHASEHAQ